jgi:hypothetical protein
MFQMVSSVHLEKKCNLLIGLGPCSIFSPQGVRWVNLLVGDDSFGLAIPTLKTCQTPSRCNLDVNFRHPLPSHSILVQLVNGENGSRELPREG